MRDLRPLGGVIGGILAFRYSEVEPDVPSGFSAFARKPSQENIGLHLHQGSDVAGSSLANDKTPACP